MYRIIIQIYIKLITVHLWIHYILILFCNMRNRCPMYRMHHCLKPTVLERADLIFGQKFSKQHRFNPNPRSSILYYFFHQLMHFIPKLWDILMASNMAMWLRKTHNALEGQPLGKKNLKWNTFLWLHNV